jgi:alpha-mannosidase
VHACWEIVLRNQFHDVLPGTAITPVYDDAAEEYAQAEELVASVLASAQAMLPRTPAPLATAAPAAPEQLGDGFVFENGLLEAHVTADGSITQMRVPGGVNVCAQANVLATYRDKPRQWEAWNIDSSYERTMRRATPAAVKRGANALQLDFQLGGSRAVMRIALHEGEPFLRVQLDVDWQERRTLLRLENSLSLQTDRVLYGSPHGVVQRSARRQTPAERAKFEVPGQRYAAVQDDAGNGLAVFALDTYGWSARASSGGIELGHSLLRGTTWPDPRADLGEHRLSYAFAPFAAIGTGSLERAWRQFAHEPHVRLFTCDDDAVLVVACKPAHDGDGIVVRVRECDGARRDVRLRCAARMVQAVACDALERTIERSVNIEQEHLRFDLSPYELRTIRVRFTHG